MLCTVVLSYEATPFAKKLWPHQIGGLWLEGEVNILRVVVAAKIYGFTREGGLW